MGFITSLSRPLILIKMNKLENTQGLTNEDVREIQERLVHMAVFNSQYPKLEAGTNNRALSYIDSQTKHLAEPMGYREGFRTFWSEAKA